MIQLTSTGNPFGITCYAVAWTFHAFFSLAFCRFAHLFPNFLVMFSAAVHPSSWLALRTHSKKEETTDISNAETIIQL